MERLRGKAIWWYKRASGLQKADRRWPPGKPARGGVKGDGKMSGGLVDCPVCQGLKKVGCPACGGSGVLRTGQEGAEILSSCSACEGIGVCQCPACQGTGLMQVVPF